MSASFDKAISIVLQHEGGYSNNASDSGGETYRGISRKNWPNWAGWKILDGEYSPLADQNAAYDRLKDLVSQFYLDNFWRYGAISSQAVADKLFDIAVNSGPKEAHTLIQRSLRYLNGHTAIDGVCGPDTIAAINKADSAKLLQEIRARQAWFYAETYCAHKADDEEFLLGWMRRAVQ